MSDHRDWRLRMLEFCGPGVLSGIRAGDWFRLLRQQWNRIDLSRLPRIVTITFQSFKNSAFGLVESRRYAEAIEKVSVRPPLFILGHWRSGTTHLHQLMCQDARFSYPNSYQAAFPHIFLTFESLDARLIAPFIPKRRPMDNMELALDSPQEDEFALCGSCLMSSCMQWVFPREKEQFRKYLTFEGASSEETDKWRKAFMVFVKKLQLRNARPLLLKSPQHTARIRLLLELFPRAKFVHIHRDPFRVFQSSCNLFQILFNWHGLQRPDPTTLIDWVLEQYREMYDAFFEQVALIPKGHFHEVSYEELDRNPIEESRRLYQGLDLPDFSQVEPDLRKYVASLSGYRKNKFPIIPDTLQARIRSEWSTAFEKFGYEKGGTTEHIHSSPSGTIRHCEVADSTPVGQPIRNRADR